MKENNNHFLDGFFWGALIGGAAVFFVGTDKGKRLMKMITDEGLTSASKIEELVDTLKGEKHDGEKRHKKLFKGVPRKK